jgi:uroporphyrin-III C-methyltransferase/precorrin-2 dehydrogenase/sirohydrochlorin ferrochelatase
MMAVANLAEIAAALVGGGRKPETPVAIVENASLPTQRVVRTTLGELSEVVEGAGIVPPAVVIVGEVARIDT